MDFIHSGQLLYYLFRRSISLLNDFTLCRLKKMYSSKSGPFSGRFYRFTANPAQQNNCTWTVSCHVSCYKLLSNNWTPLMWDEIESSEYSQQWLIVFIRICVFCSFLALNTTHIWAADLSCWSQVGFFTIYPDKYKI